VREGISTALHYTHSSSAVLEAIREMVAKPESLRHFIEQLEIEVEEEEERLDVNAYNLHILLEVMPERGEKF